MFILQHLLFKSASNVVSDSLFLSYHITSDLLYLFPGLSYILSSSLYKIHNINT